MFKIHSLNPISQVGLDIFKGNYEHVESLEEADAILVRSANVHDLELHKNLEAIARAGAGVNNIPLEKCAEEGIVVFNTPGANANGVKELVIAGLLLASRDIIGGVNWVGMMKDHEDIAKLAEKNKSIFAGSEINGKKLGIIGLGAIGVLVANAANRLGMQVYGYDPFISVDAAWNLSRDIKHINDVTEIYRECDFITIHVPLLESTKGILNKEAFSQMKEGVVILNFARDLLVNEPEIGDALAEGKVKKYVTDFPNSLTAKMEGALVIPHLGASTEESEDNCAIMAVKQLMDYMENGNIKNSVNYPDCDMGVCANMARIAINHRNIPNMLGQFTSTLASAGVNISDMINKSKGNYAYSLFDTETVLDKEIIDKLKAIEGVLKIRVIK